MAESGHFWRKILRPLERKPKPALSPQESDALSEMLGIFPETIQPAETMRQTTPESAIEAPARSSKDVEQDVLGAFDALVDETASKRARLQRKPKEKHMHAGATGRAALAGLAAMTALSSDLPKTSYERAQQFPAHDVSDTMRERAVPEAVPKPTAHDEIIFADRRGAVETFRTLFAGARPEYRAALLARLGFDRTDLSLQDQAFYAAREFGFLSSVHEAASRERDAGALLTDEDFAIMHAVPDPILHADSIFRLGEGGRLSIRRGSHDQILYDGHGGPIIRYRE